MSQQTQQKPKPQTLAMLKMEKNFVGVNEKGYNRYPYSANSLQYLLGRAYQELDELSKSLKEGNWENSKKECADVSNFIDYIFEALQQPQIKQCDVTPCQFCQKGKCTHKGPIRIDSASMCAYVNRYPKIKTEKTGEE